MKKRASLALEDGLVVYGYSFGADGEKTGELVFNTSMTGYQEILTDPSYCGQIIILTYPHIGNYGINLDDNESPKIQVEGLVVREATRTYSNYRAKDSLQEFLRRNNVIGIEGVDTRMLVRHIREKGAMKAIISTIDFNKKTLVKKAKESPSILKRDLVRFVTSKEVKCYKPKQTNYRVVVLDCGIKSAILSSLLVRDCEVVLYPATTPAEEILSTKFDAILLSNGPGDPEGVPYAIETVRKLIDAKKPILGICLGHQLLALAFGGKTYKLKFGHRGSNHPVKNLTTGTIEITSQNHGFCVDPDSVKEKFELTHFNLYDGTLEGMRHKSLPIFSVQFHPEASPGPHESNYIFDDFINLMHKNSTPGAS